MYTGQWIFLASLLISAGGVKQQIELFSAPNQRGSFIVLADKIPDLKDWKFFIANAKSYCSTGRWSFYTSTNYVGSSSRLDGSGGVEHAYEQRRCQNVTALGIFNSARYIGPADTRNVSITILEDVTPWGGVEVVVEGRAGNNFPMTSINTIISHGASNWTLYTGNNFDGDSWCLRFNGHLFQLLYLNSTHPVRSVLRDCD